MYETLIEGAFFYPQGVSVCFYIKLYRRTLCHPRTLCWMETPKQKWKNITIWHACTGTITCHNAIPPVMKSTVFSNAIFEFLFIITN